LHIKFLPNFILSAKLVNNLFDNDLLQELQISYYNSHLYNMKEDN